MIAIIPLTVMPFMGALVTLALAVTADGDVGLMVGINTPTGA